MDIQALVGSAFGAIPSGVRGDFVVERTVPGVVNMIEDTRDGDTTENFSARGVLLPMGADRATSLGLVQERARQLLIPGSSATFPPTAGNTVTDSYGIEWRVVAVEALDPSGGGATSLFTLFLSQ